ncbi:MULTISPECIES: DUF4949 domain-containing protein [Legionella]|uniref:Hemin binding protein n=1 Tax=Legionella drozanskii LLAP-1 TaxID=1212489 RepID=A0A0W0SS90_9GAMM|nr:MULTISPECIES: DUF4949 domain-containing protein [Legionella]KTC86057.1 hemin binding protein [Legionella drozanskii LLAP-1]PJE10570.1 MAG: hypothetical protein CK430_09970 [Legionella sp.]
MKQPIIRFSSFILAAGLFSQVFAEMPPRPDRCPSAAVIKSAGLAYAELDEGEYTAYQFHNYGTSNIWAFGMTGIHASSTQEALAIGYQALISLNGNPAPIPVTTENVWACVYSNGAGLMSLAFTPLPVTRLNKSFKLQSLS